MLNDRVGHLEEQAKETKSKVDKLEDGVTELNKQVVETKAASEQAKEDCNETCKVRCKALEDKLLYAEVYSRREKPPFLWYYRGKRSRRYSGSAH